MKSRKNSQYPKMLDKYKNEYIIRPQDQARQKAIKILWFFRKNIRYLVFAILAVIIITAMINYKDNIFGIRKFPELKKSKTAMFEWQYKGLKYSIVEIFYKSIYDYYHSSPDKDCFAQADSDELSCYKKILIEAEEDNTIAKIALSLKEIALKNKFNNDELLELAMAFIQSIPYDQGKAEIITSLPEFYYENDYDTKSNIAKASPRFSYEVLYDNQGICTDKSILAISLADEY